VELGTTGPEQAGQRHFRFAGVKLPDGAWRYFVGNEHWQYVRSHIATARPARSMAVVNGFRGRPLILTPRADGAPGTQINFLRLPPKGVGVLDVRYED
jgi:hypothetical protein